MDRSEQERLRSILLATLDDARLSTSELRALEAVADDLVADADALAFVRNEAFRLAKERVAADPEGILAWLNRVDKVVDKVTRGAGPGEVEERVAFSPGTACLKLLGSTLRGARRTVDACVFTVTDDRISEVLLDLHARGVAVRLITDDEKSHDPGSDVKRLAEAGIGVRMDREADHMHHKFTIVDGTVLVNGSYNWTRGATNNWENLHLTSSARIVAPFQEEFERLWASL